MKNKLENIIKEACEKLYKEDKYLIKFHVCERAIVFRFGIYLEEIMRRDEQLKKYNLDNEYNRNIKQPKLLPYHIRGVYPDLIIHKRGNNRNNLMIMECKTEWNNDIEDDLDKINYFVNSEGRYKYKYGISIIFNINEVILNITEDGIKYEEKIIPMK